MIKWKETVVATVIVAVAAAILISLGLIIRAGVDRHNEYVGMCINKYQVADYEVVARKLYCKVGDKYEIYPSE